MLPIPTALAALAMVASSPAEDPPARLLGVWEYRQANSARPSGFDEEGERLEITQDGAALRGVYLGLEREGDHGLFYSLVEVTDLRVRGDGLSFTVPARALYSRRPARLGETQDHAGFTRYELRYEGTMAGETLALRCSTRYGSCPDRLVVFRRGEWAAMPRACQVAVNTAPGLESLSAPPALKDRLRSYRAGWQALCDRSASPPTLDGLLGEAMEIREAVEGEVADALAALRVRPLPGLRAGHAGSLDVDREEFHEAAGRKGTDADVHFWKHYSGIRDGALPVWVEATWDYGGCWRFGEYDWTAGLNAIVALRSKPLAPTYAKLVRGTEESLWNGLEGPRDLCTCGPTAAVVPDLEAILRFVDRAPPLQEHAPRLRARITAITAGAVTMRSQKDGHCSGG